MVKKEDKQSRNSITNNAEPGPQRFIKVRQDGDIIEFRVFVTRPGKSAKRVFGGGVFEEQDLYYLAVMLGELARNAVGGPGIWNFETDEAWEGEEKEANDA